MSTTIAATLTVLGAGVTAWIVHDLQAWAEQVVQRKHANDYRGLVTFVTDLW